MDSWIGILGSGCLDVDTYAGCLDVDTWMRMLGDGCLDNDGWCLVWQWRAGYECGDVWTWVPEVSKRWRLIAPLWCVQFAKWVRSVGVLREWYPVTSKRRPSYRPAMVRPVRELDAS